jgi:dTDP-4-amino-4,6-dideoxygalactose transaminase
MANGTPAILGGTPAFPAKLSIVRPTVPPIPPMLDDLKSVFGSGQLTNGPNVAKLERLAADYLAVEEVVAVSCCTSGLVLTLRALGISGEVILPSFTFHASGSVLLWNNLTPVFADCEPDTFCIDPKKVEKNITGKTGAILAVHMYGHPAEVKALEAIAARHSIPLICDAAHAFGSRVDGAPVGGFGQAEVFSLSPTKLLTTAEGGLVATNDRALATLLRAARNYGDPGSYDPEVLGLNARMSELHATLGVHAFKLVDENIRWRNSLRAHYEEQFSRLPGLKFQQVRPHMQTTCKDFSILVDPKTFGLPRDLLFEAMRAENLEVKKYFDPPLHLQKLYKSFFRPDVDPLEVTEKISSSVLSLPIYWGLSTSDADAVVGAVEKIQTAFSKLSAREQADVFSRTGSAVARAI